MTLSPESGSPRARICAHAHAEGDESLLNPSLAAVPTGEGSPFTHPCLLDALKRAIQATLEVMFFVDLVDEEAAVIADDSPDADAYPCAEATLDQDPFSLEVTYRGTSSGLLCLTIDSQLAAYCHAGFQPADDGLEMMDPLEETANAEAVEVSFSMLELANIVCGAFLSNAWPDGLFRVEEPVLVCRPGMSGIPTQDQSKFISGQPLALTLSCDCLTTEGRIGARVYTSPGLATSDNGRNE